MDPMYIPGRSRTGSRPLRTVMSLAAYATRAYLVHSPTGGRTDGWGKGVRPGPKTGKTAGQSTEIWCPQCTRRGPRTGGVPADFAALRGVPARAPAPRSPRPAPTHGRRPLDDVGLEVAQLGRPDGSSTATVSTPSRTDTSRACAATSSPTTSVQCASRSPCAFPGGRPSSAPTAASASASAHRLVVGAARHSAPLGVALAGIPARRAQPSSGVAARRDTRLAHAHAASSTRPASTRSMRSAAMPRGTAPAVVTNVCPASRCATSATDALVVELAEDVVEQQHRLSCR